MADLRLERLDDREQVWSGLERAGWDEAQTHAGGEVSFNAHDCCYASRGISYDQSGWQNGYAVGAGIDYALTDKLILGIDCTHIDLGSKTGTGPNVYDDNGQHGANPETFKIKARADAVMARLSYKFGN